MTNTRTGIKRSMGLQRPSRRHFLSGGGALTLSACATPCPPPPFPIKDTATALIDGHCHLFNAKDLSTVRFLSYVVAKHYPEQADIRADAVEDPDYVDLFFEVLLDVVGADAAPSAKTELALLEGHALRTGGGTEDKQPVDSSVARAELVDRLSNFLGGQSYLKRTPTPADSRAEADLRELIVRFGGQASAMGEKGIPALSSVERRAVVTRALQLAPALPEIRASNKALPSIYLPGTLEFVKQLKRFRHCLVDELAHLHRDVSGQSPQLMAPAMVDFGRWLRDDPDAGSTFEEQVAVWPAISRRQGGPAVHGYVAYCPLRQVQFKMNRFGSGPGQINTACGDIEPLALVDRALSQNGFVGVKVYPPMGFRATRNNERSDSDHKFPKAILKDVYGRLPKDSVEAAWMYADLGGKLDAAMMDLAQHCRDHGAVIMAHGGNSVSANCDTGELADPYYWKGLFDLPDSPPIMLAHFGSFAYWTADPTVPAYVPPPPGTCQMRLGRPDFSATWEAWLARYVQANPDKPVFADISYMSEALSSNSAQATITNLRELSNRGLTEITNHLVFGTDWVMLAQEKNAQVYSKDVRALLTAAFDQNAADKIMRENFLRYTGLRRGNATFKRLAKVYNGDARLEARLAQTCA